MDQLCYPPQARWSQSAAGYPHRTMPCCVTADQGHRHRLFDRVQKESAAGKPAYHLGVNHRSQRTQTGVRKLALGAQFDLAIPFLSGSHQCRIGNTELQMRHFHESDPLSLMTVA